MNAQERLAALHAMTAEQVRDYVANLMRDKEQIASLSPDELAFFATKTREWQAENARMQQELLGRLAAWNPPISAATGRAWRN